MHRRMVSLAGSGDLSFVCEAGFCEAEEPLEQHAHLVAISITRHINQHFLHSLNQNKAPLSEIFMLTS